MNTATQPAAYPRLEQLFGLVNNNTMGNVSTAELAIYATLSIPTLYILIKHRPPGYLGWFYLLTFFSLRIVGGVLSLTGNSAASIVSNIGISPLLLAAAGILHEA